MKKFLCSLAMISGLVACGTHTTDSGTQAIGTDLVNGDPDKNNPTYLYWVDGADMKQGVCNPEETAVLHANCENDVHSMSFDAFKVSLDNGLSATISELETQVKVIKKTIKQLGVELAATKAELARTTAESAQAQEDLRQKRQEMEKLEDFIAEYREQLRLIEVELSKLEDQDLEEMSVVIADQLEDTRHRLKTVYQSVKELTRRIKKLAEEISDLGVRIVDLVATIEDLNKQLVATEFDLAVARDMFKIYTNTLYKLEHRIIFIVKSDSTWFEANRRYVKMFGEIFAAAASKDS